MKSVTALLIYISLLLCWNFVTISSSFKVVKVDTTSVEVSRMHSIKTMASGSLLKCMQECKSLSPTKYPACSVVQYNDTSKSCDLSYVHKSSKPVIYDRTGTTKNVFPVPGSEISGTY